MNRRHAIEARALQAKAIEALRAISATDMDATDIVRYLMDGSRLERLALGEVTEHTKQEVRSEGHLEFEVVEKIVLVRDESLTPAPTALALPTATGRADAESLGFDCEIGRD